MEVPQLIAGPDFGVAEEISELVPIPNLALGEEVPQLIAGPDFAAKAGKEVSELN